MVVVEPAEPRHPVFFLNEGVGRVRGEFEFGGTTLAVVANRTGEFPQLVRAERAEE